MQLDQDRKECGCVRDTGCSEIQAVPERLETLSDKGLGHKVDCAQEVRCCRNKEPVEHATSPSAIAIIALAVPLVISTLVLARYSRKTCLVTPFLQMSNYMMKPIQQT